MVKHEGSPNQAEQKAKEILDRMARALSEAAAAVEADASKDLLEVFPEPTERRTDTEFELPTHQEKAFRSAMAQLGVGRETDRGAAEAGLQSGYVAIIEGGLAHKIKAEINTVLSDPATRPSIIVVTAAPDRKIQHAETDKAKERTIIAKLLGVKPEDVADNEYEMVKQLFAATQGFSEEAETLFDGGYTTTGDVISEPTGQFVQIGRFPDYEAGPSKDIHVILMRIDREYSEDHSEYTQPGTREVLDIVDQLMAIDGNDSDIGFVTSATYQPSREVDAASSILKIGAGGRNRHVGIITYGTATLAGIKQESIPQPPHLGQLAGEAHKTVKTLAVLRKIIDEVTSNE